MVPKPVWIALGVIAATAGIAGLFYWGMTAYDTSRAAAEERTRAEQATRAAADQRQREQNARTAKQRRIDALGARNAAPRRVRRHLG